MKRMVNVLCALLLGSALGFAAGNDAEYRVANRFSVGGEGGWDYVTFDPDRGRLFVTRGSHVMVLDAANGKVLGDIPDTPGVHGVALAADLGVGAISNGRGGTVTIFDLKTLKKTADVKSGENPDAILYDPASHHVFAFNGRSQDATVIDPAKGVAVATIPLGGKPEFGVSDLRGRVYVNIEDKSEIASIDASTNRVAAKWPLKDCEEPTGLAIDRFGNRLFSVCANQKMVVLDAASGKMVASMPIGKRPDAAEFDPETHLVFSSNGEGSLTIVHQDSPDKYTVVQTLPTSPGARTMALDAKSHTVYLITAKQGPTRSATAEQPHPRPAMLPGSFEVIVVSRK